MSDVTFTPQQIREAAVAYFTFLNAESTVIPSRLRRQLAVLEAILDSVAGGRAVLVKPASLAVKSADASRDESGQGVQCAASQGEDQGQRSAYSTGGNARESTNGEAPETPPHGA